MTPRPGGDASGPGGAIIGAPPAANDGEPGVVCARVAPQLRQNFMPGGFSPRQAPHFTSNPALGAGVVGGGAIALPQFRQNDEPIGLW